MTQPHDQSNKGYFYQNWWRWLFFWHMGFGETCDLVADPTPCTTSPGRVSS